MLILCLLPMHQAALVLLREIITLQRQSVLFWGFLLFVLIRRRNNEKPAEDNSASKTDQKPSYKLHLPLSLETLNSVPFSEMPLPLKLAVLINQRHLCKV